MNQNKSNKGANKKDELAKLLVNRQPVNQQTRKPKSAAKYLSNHQKSPNHKPFETISIYKEKSKSQLKREAKEKAQNFMGCFWLAIIALIIMFFIWL
jgi:hypothetical protein